MGDETTVPYLRECFEKIQPLGQAIHRRVMNDFRQYILTGGMPQAVDAYRKTKSFEDADRIKKEFLLYIARISQNLHEVMKRKYYPFSMNYHRNYRKPRRNISFPESAKGQDFANMKMLLCG